MLITCQPTGYPHLERLGSDYGGWVIPTDALPNGAICYCAGAGEDVTFELELMRRFQANVYSIDPTPRALRYIASLKRDGLNLRSIPLGLWSSTRRMRFYAPENSAEVSHSIANLQRTTDWFEADCITVSDLMSNLGHAKLDLLKMDIEGAEYEVLDDMTRSKVAPRILCVEFDQTTPVRRTLEMVRKLRKEGYELLHIDRFNFTFLKTPQSEEMSVG